MRYVGHGFSSAMLSDLDVLIVQHEISYEIFCAESYTAKSVIGHEGLAQLLNLEYNPGTIIVNPGDVYIEIISKGGKLPRNIKSWDDIPNWIEFKTSILWKNIQNQKEHCGSVKLMQKK